LRPHARRRLGYGAIAHAHSRQLSLRKYSRRIRPAGVGANHLRPRLRLRPLHEARAAWTSDPNGRFHLRIADHSRVTRYRFGTKTADFHVCATCGAIPIVTCTVEGARYAVFNINTFDDIDRSQLVATATDFEGETTESRLARRRRNWTPEAAHGEDGD